MSKRKYTEVVYEGPLAAVVVPGVGEFVKGEPTKVLTEVADRLLEQSIWSENKSKPDETPADEE